MRILIFHPALPPYRVDFYNTIARRAETKVVFQARNLTSQPFDQARIAESVRFDAEYMKYTWVGKGRKLSVGYGAYIRRFKPDVVLGCEYGTGVLIPYLLRPFFRKKYNMWTYSDDSIDKSIRCGRVRALLRRFFASRLDGLIFANPDTMVWMQERFPMKAATVIPIIADEDVLRARLSSCLPELPKLLENAIPVFCEKIVLFVGRLVGLKNLHRLLEAFAILPEDTSLVVVGDGEERAPLEEDARRVGVASRTVFAGRFEAPELYLWYQAADVLVLPSTYESFGAVVGEALQTGCPVVCSELAGAVSLIRPGESGEVVDPYSVTDIAEGIRKVLSRAPERDPGVLRASLMTETLSDSVQKWIDILHENVR